MINQITHTESQELKVRLIERIKKLNNIVAKSIVVVTDVEFRKVAAFQSKLHT